jgi:outer membrane protein insertion porin family
MKNFLCWIGTSITVAMIAAFTSAATLHAQQIQAVAPTVSYERQKISSVQLAGQPDDNVRRLRPLIAAMNNAQYSQTQVDQAAAELRKAGPFDNVEVQVAPAAEGLHVIFILEPAYYFGVFTFSKAEKRFTYTRLLQATNYSKQEPYTRERVEEAESNLLEFFHHSGYFRATVEPKLEIDRAHGVVNVAFDINLKRHAEFGTLNITGVPEAQSKHLADSLHALRARIRGAYLKPGKPYRPRKVQAATTYLQQQLGKQHYLASRVKLVSTVYNPQTNRADITFEVTQGPAIAIRVAGAHIWGRTQKKLIPMYQENSVDADLVNEGAQDLTSYLQSKGYFDVKVQSKIERGPSGFTVLYQIDKGKRGKVKDIEFHGNDHFSDKELKSRVPVSRGAPLVFYSHGKYSEQLVRKSVKNLEGLYHGAGYSEVKVLPKVARNGGDLQLSFQVVEGVRDVVESLDVEGNRSLSQQQLAPEGMNLEPGKPYSTQLLTKDRDQIMASYLDRGFLNMTFKSTVQHAKQDPHRVQVLYQIDEGPQVHTSAVTPLGSLRTRPEIIARNVNIKVGKPLSATTMLRGESQLYTLGVFDWASVDMRKPIADQTEADVLVKLHEAKRNSIAYGFGFQVINRGGSIPSGTVALPGLPPVGLPKQFTTSQETFWGPEGSIEYTRRNFRGRAETIILAAVAARLDQRGSASWENPTFWNTSWSSTVNVSAERTSENPIYTARLGGAGVQFQHYMDKDRQKSVIFRYAFSRTNLSNILIPDLVLPQDQKVRLSTLSALFSRDSRDHPLDAHRGIYESVQLDMNPKLLGSNTSFSRFLGQVAYYRSLNSDSSLVWANSFRLGLEHAFGGQHIPISENFFSGGGSTLRGYSLNGAGPQRAVLVCPPDNPNCNETISVPVGGQMLVIFNSELRFPLGISLPLVGGQLGAAAFYDGGNVYSSVRFSNIFTDFSNTIGSGLRYKTPVGPVRIDVGYLLNRPPGIRPYQFFVTLGQAF